MENEIYQTPETENEEFIAPAEAPVEAPAEAPAQTPIQKILANKKLLTYAGIAVVAVIALILIISLFKGPNKYTTPLDLEMKVKNAKTYKAYEKAQLSITNGLADDEMADLMKIMKKSDEFDADDQKDEIEDKVEGYEDEYGKNYKFYYEIEDKDKIDKDDLKDIEDDLQDNARDMYDEIKDTDTDDLEDMAEMMGLKKADAKKIKSIMESYYKTLKKAKVSAGYELEVTYYVDGKELEEPEKLSERTITVYKVNGRWVSLDNLDISLF